MPAQIIYLNTRRPQVVARAEPTSGNLFRTVLIWAPFGLAAWYGIFRLGAWLVERVIAGLV